MNIIPTLYLAAVLAGPLHAQVCSGGAGGGIDAAGSQCGDAATIGQYTNGSEFASPLPAVKMSGIQQPTAATAERHPTAKMSGAAATSTVPSQGASRSARAELPPSAPAKTSKIEFVDASPCAGGAEGGMDATGNQCAEHPVAGVPTGNSVAARR